MSGAPPKSAAAARAEARRKAILSRGTDRLAKLTTSARGEDAPAYVHDDPPLPNLSTGLRSFVGEESADMPKPRSVSSNSQNTPTLRSVSAASRESTVVDPLEDFMRNMGNTEDRQQFMLSLLGGRTPQPPGSGAPPPAVDTNTDDPLAAMLQQFGIAPQAGVKGASPKIVMAEKQPPTLFQRLIPLLHLILTWGLLVYFVFLRPSSVANDVSEGVDGASKWWRWAELGRRPPTAAAWQDDFLLSFFRVFLAVQIVLQSMRIFSGFDTFRVPSLLGLVMPHLPAPFPAIIAHTFKYMQMSSIVLNDIALLIVGLGFVVAGAGMFT
ncbi:hypothetical protein FISHEDRAFT_34225 [Fistulina hepatica ATCC 64428]|uniref:GET complex, subunit GET2 n=1 Tax=Fistulina hepatica ATCC 64428 TaxID=1128425 RepID=A0A0D7AMY4_9AGAR|nr:hypothetical protein FISHEDRAFT_34225 [Fistulina hepatica ATCC 64428]